MVSDEWEDGYKDRTALDVNIAAVEEVDGRTRNGPERYGRMGYDLPQRSRQAFLTCSFNCLPLMKSTACILGASVIYVDVIAANVFKKRTFRIEDSNEFLSSSLSLSFGVMVRPRTAIEERMII